VRGNPPVMRRLIARVAVLCGAVLGVVVALILVLYGFLSRTDAELVSSGETRRYLLHVPDRLDPSRSAPLVISLHGAWLYPGMQKRLTGWNTLADEHGFIVAYPRATGFPRTWALQPGARLDAEVRFFSDLLDEMVSRFNVDPNRIYVSGFSNGAAMAFMLSCTLPHRIAAFGMVATAIVPWDWCIERRPVSMLAFHGTADAFVPYAGGENFLTTGPLIGMEAWFAQWGRRNGCDLESIDTALAEDVRLREFVNCAGGVATRLYTLHGAGHIWPGGRKLPEFGTGRHTNSINATREMWSLFQQHSLQRVVPAD
jgi:polyhydroxybutyrate depolymerase